MYVEYISLYSRIAEPVWCLKRYVSNATYEDHFYTALLKKMRYIWIALLICSSVCGFVRFAPFCYLCFICTERHKCSAKRQSSYNTTVNKTSVMVSF